MHTHLSHPRQQAQGQATDKQQLAMEGGRGRWALHPFLVHRVLGRARRSDRADPGLCLWDQPVQHLTQQHGVQRDEKPAQGSRPTESFRINFLQLLRKPGFILCMRRATGSTVSHQLPPCFRPLSTAYCPPSPWMLQLTPTAVPVRRTEATRGKSKLATGVPPGTPPPVSRAPVHSGSQGQD